MIDKRDGHYPSHYWLGFLAGLASFLSPCVFSLVPAYIGYLSGRAAGGENTASNRWITFTHGLAFVLGFSVVFIILGVAASAAGGLLVSLRFWLARIGGFVVIVFGLHMIGILRIPSSNTMPASTNCRIKIWAIFRRLSWACSFRPAGRLVLGRYWARS